MGNFANNAITDAGRILLASAQTGAKFDATRIVIGEGYLPPGMTVNTIKDVVAPVKSLPLNKKEFIPDGKAIFGGAFSNEDVSAAFYFRELAIYGRMLTQDSNGDYTAEGEEVLYSYGNAGANADLIPAYSTETVVEKQLDIVVWVGNDTKVNLTLESGIYASREDLEALRKELEEKGGIIIIPEGEDIPPPQRKKGHFYIEAMDEAAIRVSPNMRLKIE